MRYLLLLLLFPFVVAAEQVAVISKGAESIELHDSPIHGLCPKDLKEAVYKSPSQTVEGCWKFFPEHGAIVVAFVDGDGYAIPVDDFTWRRGRKPIST